MVPLDYYKTLIDLKTLLAEPNLSNKYDSFCPTFLSDFYCKPQGDLYLRFN